MWKENVALECVLELCRQRRATREAELPASRVVWRAVSRDVVVQKEHMVCVCVCVCACVCVCVCVCVCFVLSVCLVCV